ncbi:MAG TPA: YSC84-related protein [Terriglobales bacterium]|nr:YSC84-related protein [Terriglobales bacterium]
MQKIKAGTMMIVGVVFLLPVAVNAESKEEQQKKILEMAQQSLQQLYEKQPAARAAVKNAAGYAVFSDFGVKIFFAGSGDGNGVAVNNKTSQQTFMKMVELQAGLGFGIKKFRNIFVFDTEKALNSFVNSGWQFGGQATAAAKTATSGSAMAGAAQVDDGVWLYQITEKGLEASITATGAKYYKNDSLN